MDELRSCPFCGGEAKLEGVGDDGLSYHVAESWVECDECEAQAVAFLNDKYDEESSEACREKAIAAWNKRI